MKQNSANITTATDEDEPQPTQAAPAHVPFCGNMAALSSSTEMENRGSGSLGPDLLRCRRVTPGCTSLLVRCCAGVDVDVRGDASTSGGPAHDVTVEVNERNEKTPLKITGESNSLNENVGPDSQHV